MLVDKLMIFFYKLKKTSITKNPNYYQTITCSYKKRFIKN